MASIQKILEAVTTLSTIQDEDKKRLLTHRKELESAINKLQAVLQSSNYTTQSAQGTSAPPPVILSDTPQREHSDRSPSLDVIASGAHGLEPPSPDPSGSGLCGDTLEDPPAAPNSPPSRSDVLCGETMNAIVDLPNSVKAVLKTLSKRCQQIRTCTYQPEGLVIPNELATEDPRVVDIFLVCGRRTLSDFFRAGLSALSLADDYADWAEAVAYPSRLDALCKDIDTKDGAHYLKYTKACSRFRDSKRASVYIEYGIRYRFFERLCAIRSQGPTSNDPNTIPPRQLGITALLFFAWTSFYRCRYQDLPALASALLASEEFREMAKKSNEEIELCLKAHKDQAVRLGQSRKRILQDILADGATEEQRKRRRSEHSDSAYPVGSASENSTSSMFDYAQDTSTPYIRPFRLPVGSVPENSTMFDYTQDNSTPYIRPFRGLVFQQDPLAPNSNPFSRPVFPDQSHVDNPQDIAPSPQPLSGGLATAVNDMMTNLQHEISNQPRSP